MLVVNGAAIAGTDVWCQFHLVNPNTIYNFSAWVTSVHPVSPAQLQFYINGIPLGPVFSPSSTCCAWVQFIATWNSGANTSATICIKNMNISMSGNDFALDDISFRSCMPCSDTISVMLTQPAPVVVTSISSTNEFCNLSDGTASVSAGGGNGNYTYLWNLPGQSSSVVTGLVAGNYSIIITDGNGCMTTQTVTVNSTDNACMPIDCSKNIFLPNAFSPNDDGENDYFEIYGEKECVQSARIVIYNRWGEIIFKSSDSIFQWDGSYRGTKMNTSVFTYYFSSILKNGDKISKQGNISLVR